MLNPFKRLFDRNAVALDLDHIQGYVLGDRPTPYYGTHALLRFDSAEAGRALLARVRPLLPSAHDWQEAVQADAAWTALAISFEGLKALSLPEATLQSFPEAFRAGMAARAKQLHDVGENAPQYWEQPYGQQQIHVALTIIAGDEARWQAKRTEANQALTELPGVQVLGQHDFAMPTEITNVFGFRDGISNPEVAGSGTEALPGYDRPIKPGEFLLGYPGESGVVFPTPQPAVLGKNGTYLVFRKYHSRVAEFNRYLHEHAPDEAGRELLAAKFFGRWRSGAPLTLAPERDDPALGRDLHRNNDFSYKGDELGKVVPLGCHMRRMNPRDTQQSVISDVNLHRIIRRSVSFGPLLPPDQTQDDGQERGLYYLALSAKAPETVEFLQSQWINDGNFVSLGDEKDPMVGLNAGKGVFTVPQDPLRRRYANLETFNVLRGGEYFFVPGLPAIEWLSQPHS